MNPIEPMTTTGDHDDLKITLGVEEECFLVDPQTRDLLIDPDPGIFETCEKTCGPHKIVRELMRSQIESNTRVCESVAELREALIETRRIIISAAERYGAAVMAASTHPFARWQVQSTTPKERYEQFVAAHQDNLRRFLIGGMHIHAGFGDADARIRVMTALRQYLPLLLALSTSSPFSDGRGTGFKSWRMTVVGSLPRSGLPAPFGSSAEYEKLLAELQRCNFVTDGSELWWDIRPSHAYPTVEMRICDVCTRLEDAVSMAALYASLIRWLLRRDRDGDLTPGPLTELISEDRWNAHRYGVFSFFGDRRITGSRVDIQDYLAELIEELAADARALGCEPELRYAMTIIREGTSADRQLDLYQLRCLEGDTHEEALCRVVDLLLAETRAEVEAA